MVSVGTHQAPPVAGTAYVAGVAHTDPGSMIPGQLFGPPVGGVAIFGNSDSQFIPGVTYAKPSRDQRTVTWGWDANVVAAIRTAYGAPQDSTAMNLSGQITKLATRVATEFNKRPKSAPKVFAVNLSQLVAFQEQFVDHTVGSTDVMVMFRTTVDSRNLRLNWRVISTTRIGVTADQDYAAGAVRVIVMGGS